eukprot:TRINITY_DN6334_c0_g1_i1.p1 TRINITY_DN6334_c0_g1~~TRINITY_DN6334_c0_g1_i1.p1  ORF type:complete len:205 (+),score=71.95 TRINITY_DN6334_c0_g1_i1:3-617(+)
MIQQFSVIDCFLGSETASLGATSWTISSPDLPTLRDSSADSRERESFRTGGGVSSKMVCKYIAQIAELQLPDSVTGPIFTSIISVINAFLFNAVLQNVNLLTTRYGYLISEYLKTLSKFVKYSVKNAVKSEQLEGIIEKQLKESKDLANFLLILQSPASLGNKLEKLDAFTEWLPAINPRQGQYLLESITQFGSRMGSHSLGIY